MSVIANRLTSTVSAYQLTHDNMNVNANMQISNADVGALNKVPVDATGTVTIQEPLSVDDNGSSLSIDDGGNTITVDGTVNVGTVTTVTNVVHVDDNAGNISIDDGGNVITVDGTVTANAGANLNTSALALEAGNLATIAGDTTSIDGKITTCNTGAVTISALPNEGQQTMANSISVAIASNQSVIPVNDNSSTLSVDDGGGAITVDGTVTSNLSAVDNAVLDQIELNTDPLLVVGGGTEATAQRVTIANNSTGVVSVDDNGGVLTVDGTVNVGTVTTITNVVHVDDNASSLTIDNADITSIKNAAETIDNAIAGAEMQVDVVSSALPTGASTSANQTTIIGHVDGIETVLGTIDTDTGNIATSLGNMDNSVDGNYLNVNMNVAGTDVASNAGVLNAQTIRVTIATDDECNNLLGTIDTDTGNIAASTGVMDDWDNGASDGASVSGDVAHDSADAGEPVKIGCKAIDMTPNTEGEQGPSDVAANDRVNSLSHLDGTLVECVRAEYQLLTEIDQTYDADPTTATSSNYPCWQYRQCTFSTDITKANTPTDILFDIETSCDNGSSYQKFRYQWTSDWRYDDTSVGASGKKVSKTFPICCTHLRVKVTCAGTDANNTFTIDNSSLMFRN